MRTISNKTKKEILTKAKALVGKVTYKKGLTMSAVELIDGIGVRAGLPAPGADNPGVDGIAQAGRIISWEALNMQNQMGGIETFLTHQFFQLLSDLEMHECKEFFRVGGVKIFDPHRDEGECLTWNR